MIALVSIIPELIVTLEASLRSNYYVALSTVLGSVISLYVIGVSFYGFLYFLRWRRDFSIGRRSDYFFILIISLLMGLMGISGSLNVYWGLVLLAVFLVFSVKKASKNVLRDPKPIPALLIGGLAIWFSSQWLLQGIFSISSSLHIPPYYVAILIVPLMSNLQEISSALRSRGETVMRDLLLGIINENLMSSTLLLSIIGIASGIEGIALTSLMPLIEISFFVGVLAYLLIMNGEIKLQDSVLMMVGVLVFLSLFRV
ncbi:conserved hypothetical protein [Metallosphaera cuprina Ar-4]|uniref:Sodium/calcium exchanger membrane region domain-containing protein n=3 Tax=Metallosphaera TaxID=41980 RepID=F4G0H9_METCR|nr:conserved hypothetical protein [Metallosphaera cuprina Ar-4]